MSESFYSKIILNSIVWLAESVKTLRQPSYSDRLKSSPYASILLNSPASNLWSSSGEVLRMFCCTLFMEQV